MITLITGYGLEDNPKYNESNAQMFPCYKSSNQEQYDWAYRTFKTINEFNSSLNIVTQSYDIFYGLRVAAKEEKATFNIIYYDKNGTEHIIEFVNGEYPHLGNIPKGMFDIIDDACCKLLGWDIPQE